MKKKFYIFLDIDGVLNDYHTLIKNQTKKIEETLFNKESVLALNCLIDDLSSKYDLELVISSSWRINMAKTTLILERNGVNLNKATVSSTKFISEYERGIEILDYLENKKDNDNFVIIDDNDFDFKNYFSPSKIIKTNFMNSPLTLDKVEYYLKKGKVKKSL